MRMRRGGRGRRSFRGRRGRVRRGRSSFGGRRRRSGGRLRIGYRM